MYCLSVGPFYIEVNRPSVAGLFHKHLLLLQSDSLFCLTAEAVTEGAHEPEVKVFFVLS